MLYGKFTNQRVRTAILNTVVVEEKLIGIDKQSVMYLKSYCNQPKIQKYKLYVLSFVVSYPCFKWLMEKSLGYLNLFHACGCVSSLWLYVWH